MKKIRVIQIDKHTSVLSYYIYGKYLYIRSCQIFGYPIVTRQIIQTESKINIVFVKIFPFIIVTGNCLSSYSKIRP